MESGSFSKFGVRLIAAHSRFHVLKELYGWRAAPLQNVALASAPRTFSFRACSSFKDSHD
eukprot:651208-Pyramimonas_sp.AAC.1